VGKSRCCCCCILAEIGLQLLLPSPTLGKLLPGDVSGINANEGCTDGCCWRLPIEGLEEAEPILWLLMILEFHAVVAVCDGENADTKLLLAIAVDGDGEVRS
jgi:hypothetical protein